MIPHSLVGRSSYRAYATFGLLVVSILFFLWEMGLTSSAGQPIEKLVPHYAFVTCEVGRVSPFELLVDGVRGVFMHLSFGALLLNMVYLWLFAPRVEQFLTPRRFLQFFFLGAVGGYVASWIALRGQCAAVVGPNAAIAAVMGGFLFLYPAQPVDTYVALLSRKITLPAFVFLLLYFASQFFMSEGGPLSGVTLPIWDEIGGFLTGFIGMFVITLFRPAPSVDPVGED
ncbi:MAG: rhomboid family intramembrane serine protease [Anaerolineae bacterium]|nr:rhomboid family intramembrane serine protease [Anaerolineae bacterium]MDW8172115.1 rhomboid family intramembrane serine protease [Anaerolineae bacterium]